MIIRTVLGDIAPDELGVTLGHEHIYAVPPADITDRDLYLDDETKALDELRLFKEIGGGAVIEMTTRDYGRDAAVLARVSKASDIHVIAATGFNKGKFADRISSGMSTSEIAQWMEREVREGIDDTQHRAGLIKASSSLDGPGEHEKRVFEAAANAHIATGVPISTHTEKGTWAAEQVALLGKFGVQPHRILLGHLDLKPELDYLKDVAATGAYLGFDQFSKAKYLPDAERVRLICALVSAGFGNRILMSGDMARRSYHQAYGGGPGFAHIPGSIFLLLAANGLSVAEIEALKTGNARDFLAFQPK